MLAGLTTMFLTLIRNDSTAMFRALAWYSFAPYFILHYAARIKPRRGRTMLHLAAQPRGAVLE